MNIMVLDTETISLNKPFCYNLGYVIFNRERGTVITERDFVIKKLWYNKELFETAYYANKRKKYVNALKGRKTRLISWKDAMKTLSQDIDDNNVEFVYAYNSNFDERVMAFNCTWNHCDNPIDGLPFYDIRGNAMNFICDDEFFTWCEEHGEFTEGGNYKTTAETLIRYLIDEDFIEEHTALADSMIETNILFFSTLRGAKIGTSYKPGGNIQRKKARPVVIRINGKMIYQGKYIKKYARNDEYNFVVED